MLVDVDGLQKINQTYGHAVGDEVVIAVARVLRASGRRCDHVSRMGGAEFLVVCPNTEPESLGNAAQRLSDAVRSLEVRAGDKTLAVTICVGMASREPGMHDMDALIRAVDRALRFAKKAGQARIGVTSEGHAHTAAG